MSLAQQVDFLVAGVIGNTTSPNYSGKPLSGGKAYFYSPGTTSLKTVWVDAEKATAATNPVILDTSGSAKVFADGLYDVVVMDADTNLMFTVNEAYYVIANSAASGPAFTVQNISANTVLTAINRIVIVDTSGGNVTVTMPAAASFPGGEVVIVNNGANRVIINPSGGGELLSGASSYTLINRYQDVRFIAAGGNWQDSTFIPAQKANKYRIIQISADYTVPETAVGVSADATGGAIKVTLPTYVGVEGEVIIVGKSDASTNPVTIVPQAGQNISGKTSMTLPIKQHTVIELRSSGASWGVVGRSDLYDPTLDNLFDDPDFKCWYEGETRAALATLSSISTLMGYIKVGTMVHTGTKELNVPTIAQAGGVSDSSLRVTVTTAQATLAAGDLSIVKQTIIGQKVRVLAQKHFAVGFWVYASVTGTYCFAIQNSASDRSFVSEYTINAALTWEYKEIVIPMNFVGGGWDYNTGHGLKCGWVLGAGSSWQTTKDTWQTGNYVSTSNQVNSCASNGNIFALARIQGNPGPVVYPFYAPTVEENALIVGRQYETSYENMALGSPPVVPGTNTTVGICGAYGYDTSNAMANFRFRYQKRDPATLTVKLYSKLGTYQKISKADLTDIGTVVTVANLASTGFSTIQDSAAGLLASTPYLFHFVADNRMGY